MVPDALGPEAGKHWQRADEDLQDCRDLLAAGKYRWAITALFYSALHRLNACLIDQGRRPTSHALRDLLIAHELPRISRDYLWLKQLSERVRYWPDAIITQADVEAALQTEYQAIMAAMNPGVPD